MSYSESLKWSLKRLVDQWVTLKVWSDNSNNNWSISELQWKFEVITQTLGRSVSYSESLKWSLKQLINQLSYSESLKWSLKHLVNQLSYSESLKWSLKHLVNQLSSSESLKCSLKHLVNQLSYSKSLKWSSKQQLVDQEIQWKSEVITSITDQSTD